MIKIGIIGCGHWGPNYVRSFNKISGAKAFICADLKDENLKRVKELCPGIKTTKDYKDILKDKEVSAVVVATPASTHFQIVKDALEKGKDVLAEKPLTLIPEKSLELVSIAEERKKILMVGHTFLFNPGIVKLKGYVDSGEIGKIYYMNATRTHLGLIREDVNAVWDLAPHDISIFNYLTGNTPISISAVGSCHLKKDREDVAFVNMVYPNNIIANIHVSWVDSNKERTIRIVGSKARAVFNDLDNMERVKLFKKGISCEYEYDDYGEFQLFLRDGDIISPKIEMSEPLKNMCLHFIECITERKKPISDGKMGYEVVKALYEIKNSLANCKDDE